MSTTSTGQLASILLAIRSHLDTKANKKSLDALNELARSLQEEGFVTSSMPIVIMPEEALENLSPEQAIEDVLYYGKEESVTTWHFGDKFPIRFS